jgi:hypothetical protein
VPDTRAIYPGAGIANRNGVYLACRYFRDWCPTCSAPLLKRRRISPPNWIAQPNSEENAERRGGRNRGASQAFGHFEKDDRGVGGDTYR